MTRPAIRLTRNRLNAYLWAKQRLGTRQRPGTRSPPGDDGRKVVELAERNFGLYGTAPTCYLSLLARIPEFRLGHLDEEIVTRRRLVRLRAMRVSQFLVSAADLPMTYQATKDLPQADFGKILKKMGVSYKAYRETARRVETLLAERPRTATELRKEIRPGSGALSEGFPFLISEMCHEGRLVRGAARGGWKSDRFEYARLQDWLPDVDLESVRPDDARRDLARRYFAAYGPATAADFHWWSGLTKGRAAAALEDLGGELAEVDVLGLKGTYLALAQERPALESRSGPAPRGVALLPVWDAYVMAYSVRSRYLDPEWVDRVFDRGGNATSTALWHGRVAGVWDFDELEKRLRVKIAPLSDFPHAAWKSARQAAQRMARAIGKKELIVERCPPPRPLSEGSRNRFLSPLKGVSGVPV